MGRPRETSRIGAQSESILTLSTVRLAIVLPVHSEGLTIASTLREIHSSILAQVPNGKVLVFEDGSRDNTKEVLKGLAKENAWLRVETSEERKGYPKAARDAILSVDPHEFDLILFMDSDGQYDPSDFFHLWQAFSGKEDGGVDFVIGRRMNRSEPFYRMVLRNCKFESRQYQALGIQERGISHSRHSASLLLGYPYFAPYACFTHQTTQNLCHDEGYSWSHT